MTRGIRRSVAALLLSLAASGAEAQIIVPEGSVKLQDVVIDTPRGWTLVQDAVSGDTAFAVFASGGSYVTIYARRGESYDTRSLFLNGATIVGSERRERRGPLDATILDTRKTARNGQATNVTGFVAKHRGNTYFGYGSAATADVARRNLSTFLEAIR